MAKESLTATPELTQEQKTLALGGAAIGNSNHPTADHDAGVERSATGHLVDAANSRTQWRGAVGAEIWLG